MRVAIDVLREVAKNTAMAIPVIRVLRLRRPRTSDASASSNTALERFAFGLLGDLFRFVGGVAGLRILEVGPGDHLLFGLAVLAAGAASYTAIDRFPGEIGSLSAKAWYAALRRVWPEKYPDLPWPSWLQPGNFPEAYSDRVRFVPAAVEDVTEKELGAIGSCDVVCSHLVGEHVADIEAFATTTAKLLATGGIALHLSLIHI